MRRRNLLPSAMGAVAVPCSKKLFIGGF
uniref:Uncharacterized protein n=1 Tax=Zea mays TaxID=4577 RepID=B4FVW4_MAIZE|nr:unknown [Zea mays]